jgi:hypothetical protein
MKPVGNCKGCGRKKLLNHLELCKRCNRESEKYVTEEDLSRLRREVEFVRQAKLKQKKAAAAAAAVAEEGKEAEADKDKEKDKDKKSDEKGKDKKSDDKGKK